MGRFAQRSDIFIDEDTLRDEYTPEPDELVEREEEMDEYEEALQPTVNGSQPRHIFVYGETGVGKTVATRMILSELEEDQQHFSGVSIRVVWLNCKDLTSYLAAGHLVNKFREDGQYISTTGYPRGTVHQMLWEHLNELPESHILFVLDEVDSLGTDDELLYQLPRANSNGKVTETKVGIIGISNDFTYRENLSPRVQSSLCEHEIHFAPYDAPQLQAILEPRASKAFANDVLENDVLPLAAAFAGQDTGSARHALNILYKAGSIARRTDASQVTEDHVRKAADLVERGIIEDELRALPAQSHLLLYVLTVLASNDETPARRTRIYEVYETAANRCGTTVKAPRTVHNRLSQLSLKGFLKVNEVNEGINGGKHYDYGLDVDPDIVMDALETDNRLSDLV
ncbi:Cdc6/Cdc18 family protein [Halocatena pleomorpha]|uniref:ORC1-type DNA replication protein n=1 Tax=Halocatena pleomorpha TaxID=1785090 RepID=A0A3P3R8B9_9EURY|nr:orc1/cdc6 family replication initiation protein [Halocatena pleomorpha]RRJ28783.1 AAA family ATPase [Halocatena pleomorpha]